MRDLEFSGYWEGEAVYSCDCCGKDVSFPFDSEDIDSKAHRKELRERLGWITTKVDGEWHDFCCEACRNKYIRDTKNEGGKYHEQGLFPVPERRGFQQPVR